MDRPAPKEEGCQKSDGHGIGESPSGGGCGRDVVFNNGVDPQLWIMERLVEMTAAARSDKLRCTLAVDDRYICLQFHSKGDLVRS